VSRKVSWGLATAVVLGIASAPIAAAATPSQFTLTIGPAAAMEYLAINTQGDILGLGVEPGAQSEEGFILKGGTLDWLAAPGDPGNVHSTTDPLGLNNNGQAVGFRFPTGQVVGTTIDEQERPLAWAGPGTTGVDLGVDAGLSLDVQATALNDVGQTVGVAIGPRTTPWLLQGGKVTNLPTLAGGDAEPFAINDNGLSVGSADLANGNDVAVAWQNGQLTTLGALPGGGFAEALAVNKVGMAVGASTTDAGTFGFRHAVVFAHGTVTDLNVRGTGVASAASANAINDNGVIVGADGAGDAFIYQNGQATDLNTLIPPNSGWRLVTANGINDAGDIVGDAVQISNPRKVATFELTP
jgi:probable HAF family extracellular repeat protein